MKNTTEHTGNLSLLLWSIATIAMLAFAAWADLTGALL